MHDVVVRHSPGAIRDAIIRVLGTTGDGPLSVIEIELGVRRIVGDVPSSSIRSYLNLNTPSMFERTGRGFYKLSVGRTDGTYSSLKIPTPFVHDRAKLFEVDCFDLFAALDANSVHAIITDPPYGLVEFSASEIRKLRARKGGVWRIPPSFDGAKRSPLPRFTTLTKRDIISLEDFFSKVGASSIRVLAPGGNIAIASNPLLAHYVAGAIVRAGFEPRGTIVRLVMTMRGGDRPKNAHKEFSDVSVMPRSMWEPWLIFRRPLEGRVQDNLRKWGTGGFRRISETKPFADVIESRPTTKRERDIAPHPALKPQAFLRQLIRAALPLSEGQVFDPFAGAGSVLAAANAVGYASLGAEKDAEYAQIARDAIPRLSKL
jgi:DNA modification methylase